MMLDWQSFTPWASAVGGAIIGLSAAMFLLLNGRIAGISGIVGGMMQKGGARDFGWRAAFGVGTRYGSGCTSGHGVCGISRLSPRSLVATLAFMGTGFATVYTLRHLSA